jgi:hypothetical protein
VQITHARVVHDWRAVGVPLLAVAVPLLLSAGKAGSDLDVIRVKAPPELARSELQITKDSGYEGTVCVRGLRYWTEEPGGPTEVFSTNAAALKKVGKLDAVEHFLASGTDAAQLNLTDLLCSDANFGILTSSWAIESASFDRQQLMLGDFAQDECNQTVMLAVAKKGTSYVIVIVAVKALLPSFACNPPAATGEGDCARRDECLKAFLADPANVAALKSAWRAFLRTIQFGYRR